MLSSWGRRLKSSRRIDRGPDDIPDYTMIRGRWDQLLKEDHKKGGAKRHPQIFNLQSSILNSLPQRATFPERRFGKSIVTIRTLASQPRPPMSIRPPGPEIPQYCHHQCASFPGLHQRRWECWPRWYCHSAGCC